MFAAPAPTTGVVVSPSKGYSSQPQSSLLAGFDGCKSQQNSIFSPQQVHFQHLPTSYGTTLSQIGDQLEQYVGSAHINHEQDLQLEYNYDPPSSYSVTTQSIPTQLQQPTTASDSLMTTVYEPHQPVHPPLHSPSPPSLQAAHPATATSPPGDHHHHARAQQPRTTDSLTSIIHDNDGNSNAHSVGDFSSGDSAPGERVSPDRLHQAVTSVSSSSGIAAAPPGSLQYGSVGKKRPWSEVETTQSPSSSAPDPIHPYSRRQSPAYHHYPSSLSQHHPTLPVTPELTPTTSFTTIPAQSQPQSTQMTVSRTLSYGSPPHPPQPTRSLSLGGGIPSFAASQPHPERPPPRLSQHSPGVEFVEPAPFNSSTPSYRRPSVIQNHSPPAPSFSHSNPIPHPRLSSASQGPSFPSTPPRNPNAPSLRRSDSAPIHAVDHPQHAYYSHPNYHAAPPPMPGLGLGGLLSPVSPTTGGPPVSEVVPVVLRPPSSDPKYYQSLPPSPPSPRFEGWGHRTQHRHPEDDRPTYGTPSHLRSIYVDGEEDFDEEGHPGDSVLLRRSSMRELVDPDDRRRSLGSAKLAEARRSGGMERIVHDQAKDRRPSAATESDYFAPHPLYQNHQNGSLRYEERRRRESLPAYIHHSSAGPPPRPHPSSPPLHPLQRLPHPHSSSTLGAPSSLHSYSFHEQSHSQPVRSAPPLHPLQQLPPSPPSPQLGGSVHRLSISSTSTHSQSQSPPFSLLPSPRIDSIHPRYRHPPPSDMGNEKVHECPERGCGRAFKRMEHLKRHERTHTMEKPYQCDFSGCGRYFSRSDNLTQHRKTHEKIGGRNAPGGKNLPFPIGITSIPN